MAKPYPDNRTMTEEEIEASVVQDVEAALNEELPSADPAPTIITHRHTGIAGVKSYGPGGIAGESAWPTPKQKARAPFEADGYEDLARILLSAFDQSAHGKGKQRHANGRPFKEQPIMALARLTGIDAHAYQISKKATEASAMFKRGDLEAAMAEFRGVIIYAAAAILLAEEQSRIG